MADRRTDHNQVQALLKAAPPGKTVKIARAMLESIAIEHAGLTEDRALLDWLSGGDGGPDAHPALRHQAAWRVWDGKEPWRDAVRRARAAHESVRVLPEK